MRENKPSYTAYVVAMRRAAHQLVDVPLVFEDRHALAILGPERCAALAANPGKFQRGFFKSALRAFLAARSRLAEDTLAEQVEAGIRQYVVLGAGLDTFAYRNPYPPDRLRVFEVDFPATQVWKRRLLAAGGIAVPDALTFVPIDFHRQGLQETLIAAGLSPDAGTFFSWLGVTQYLEPAAVRATLAVIATLTRAGGGVVFDYAIPPASMSLLRRLAFRLVAARLKSVGEPWRAFFTPGDLLREVPAMGFAEAEDVDGARLNQRYFAGRRDGLRVSSVGHILKAMNPPSRIIP